MADTSNRFTGSIPELYHRYLGPVLFEPYAGDLAGRLAMADRPSLLELACGTGMLTRLILAKLPEQGSLVASDLNGAMIEIAKNYVPADDRLTWKVVDAMTLPFPDSSLDGVVCQFGVMFFPDKLAAAREVRRVLKTGGRYLFNVWESLERNDMFRTAQEIMVRTFPDNPPAFYNVPYHYHDQGQIEGTLKEAGFRDVTIERVSLPCRSRSARDAARGMVMGNPMALELEQRGTKPESLVDSVAALLAERFGEEPLECRMSALVVEAR